MLQKDIIIRNDNKEKLSRGVKVEEMNVILIKKNNMYTIIR